MRTLQGTITSNRMAKTVVVRIDRLRKHPKYLKYGRLSQKFKAHAENPADYLVGDLVKIQETRPLSKDKRWKVVAVVRRATAHEGAEDGSSAHENPSQ